MWPLSKPAGAGPAQAVATDPIAKNQGCLRGAHTQKRDVHDTKKRDDVYYVKSNNCGIIHATGPNHVFSRSDEQVPAPPLQRPHAPHSWPKLIPRLPSIPTDCAIAAKRRVHRSPPLALLARPPCLVSFVASIARAVYSSRAACWARRNLFVRQTAKKPKPKAAPSLD